MAINFDFFPILYGRCSIYQYNIHRNPQKNQWTKGMKRNFLLSVANTVWPCLLNRSSDSPSTSLTPSSSSIPSKRGLRDGKNCQETLRRTTTSLRVERKGGGGREMMNKKFCSFPRTAQTSAGSLLPSIGWRRLGWSDKWTGNEIEIN